MTGATFFFALTLLVYFLSSVSYHIHLFAASERARTTGTVLAAVGVITHTAAIGLWCMSHGSITQDPGMPYSVVAYFLTIGQVALAFNSRWASIGALVMPMAFVGEFYGSWLTPGLAVHTTGGSPLLRPHVMVLLLGFAAFALAFCNAVFYLVQSRLLKTKHVKGIFTRLPPLESVGTAAHWLAVIGFSMLTLGVVTGGIVAPERWGPQWYLEPHFVISMIAWVVYAAYMGVSVLLGWRGRRMTYFLIAGFVVVMGAFFASVKQPKSAQDSRSEPLYRFAWSADR
jgi:ABC-type uncharacterized transport system permease subunit